MPDPLSLPNLSIPWKVIAASPDMMDTTKCDNRFPFAWRSSLAISLFEPPRSTLPEALNDQTIVFVRITCSLTGYQPTGAERQMAAVTFGNQPIEELTRSVEEYWGCYGALLNVAVFSRPAQGDLQQYPHILDFEPKNRELIEAASRTGQLLTSSQSTLKLDNSLTTTGKSEAEFNQKAMGKYGGVSGEINWNNKWTSEQAVANTAATTSEGTRQGTTSFTTNINQLYNLLTGYHAGTNRAVFLMLPRPETEQATDRRSFAPGLRVIEGVQDFVLAVAQPATQSGLCIEASLDTAHFPENVDVQSLNNDQYDTRMVTFTVTQFANRDASEARIEDSPTSRYTAPDGWVLDETQPTASTVVHPGRPPALDHPERDNGNPVLHRLGRSVTVFEDNSNDRALETLREFDYRAATNKQIEVRGVIQGGHPLFTGIERERQPAVFAMTFAVFLRSETPRPNASAARVLTSMLTTNRHLCICQGEPPDIGQLGAGLVLERSVAFQRGGDAAISVPAALATLRRELALSSESPDRLPSGQLEFLDTDYVARLVHAAHPTKTLEQPLGAIAAVAKQHGDKPTVLAASIAQSLTRSLPDLARHLAVDLPTAIALRRSVFTHLQSLQPEASGK